MKAHPILLSTLAAIASSASASDLSLAIPTGNSAPAAAVQGVCILTLRIEQLHWTLNPITWMQDSANASRLEIPTLTSYCSQLHEGQLLASDFRWGSYLLHGSTGDTQVRVEKIRNLPGNGVKDR